MPDHITISITENRSQLPDTLFSELLSALPPDQQNHINRFKRYQDRQASLLARLLIYHHFLQSGSPEKTHDPLFFNEKGRPCLRLPYVDCSISHSKELVVCCIGYGITVGIDIERIKTAHYSGIASTVPALFTLVPNCISSGEHFFDAWTMLESLLKADGKGFTSDFSIKSLSNNRFLLGAATWHIDKVAILPDYSCHVAFTEGGEQKPPIEPKWIGLSELIHTGRLLKNG